MWWRRLPRTKEAAQDGRGCCPGGEWSMLLKLKESGFISQIDALFAIK
jgi:hypothetical protein